MITIGEVGIHVDLMTIIILYINAYNLYLISIIQLQE